MGTAVARDEDWKRKEKRGRLVESEDIISVPLAWSGHPAVVWDEEPLRHGGPKEDDGRHPRRHRQKTRGEVIGRMDGWNSPHCQHQPPRLTITTTPTVSRTVDQTNCWKSINILIYSPSPSSKRVRRCIVQANKQTDHETTTRQRKKKQNEEAPQRPTPRAMQC